MKPVVKYGVYWDILLRVPIYVIKFLFFLMKIIIFARLLLGGQDLRSGWIGGTVRWSKPAQNLHLVEGMGTLSNISWWTPYLTTGSILDFLENMFEFVL